MTQKLRVAVIGAAGVGQHHARWYHLSGCEVAAIAGTSEASCKRARDRLAADFGFEGAVYWDLEQLFREGPYDIVDVSTPYAAHREHAVMALESGSHTICEKPLCWDESKALTEILEDGRAVVRAADEADCILAVSAQYPAALPAYRELYSAASGSDLGQLQSISMEMEVKIRRDPRPYESMWIDRASHPLSVVLAFLPDAQIVSASVSCTLSERENVARFEVTSAQGRCDVDIVMREIVEGDPIRRFGVNGCLAEWRGFPDEQGIYRAGLSHGGREIVGDDFLHASIKQMVNAVSGTGEGPVVSGEAGLRNLEMQVELLEQSERV